MISLIQKTPVNRLPESKMRKISAVSTIFLLSTLLQACSGNTSPKATEFSPELIYTSVASSLTAQSNNQPTSTMTSEGTYTVTPTKEATFSIPTLAQAAMTSVSNALVCDNASFIGDVTMTDGTTVSPGETFTKTWRIQNTGSCPWTTSYLLAFNSGESMSGVSTAFPYAVSSGNQMNISIFMTAPTDLGTYIGYWKLQNSAGTTFGQTLFVQIKVATSTSTSTPTITYTPTITSTSEATSTPTNAPTSTTAPTETTAPIADATTAS
jgi:hypothetical protein